MDFAGFKSYHFYDIDRGHVHVGFKVVGNCIWAWGCRCWFECFKWRVKSWILLPTWPNWIIPLWRERERCSLHPGMIWDWLLDFLKHDLFVFECWFNDQNINNGNRIGIAANPNTVPFGCVWVCLDNQGIWGFYVFLRFMAIECYKMH